MPSAVVGILRVLLTADTAQFTSALKQASTSAKQWSRDLNTIGRQLTALGTTLSVGVTAPLTAFAAATVKAAGDFDHAFKNVEKTVQATPEQFAAINEGLREMAKTIPFTAVELANIAAVGGQFGVAAEELLQFTKEVANLSVAVDGLGAEEAAMALAQIAKVAGVAYKDIGQLASALVDLGNKGTSTEGAILEFGKRLVGAGHQIGLTAPQILGIGAAMANLGINAEAGGTAMSRVMAKMERAVAQGGKALDDFAKVAGMGAREFADAFANEPIVALQKFIEGLGNTSAAGDSMTLVLDEMEIRDVRMVDSLKRLAGAMGEMKKQIDISNGAFIEGNRHTEEAEKKYKSFWNQLKLLKNQVTDVAIEFGNALIPVLRDLVETARPVVAALGEFAKWFRELPKSVQTFTFALAGLAALAGPTLFVIGEMAFGLKTVIDLFRKEGVIIKFAQALGLYTTAANTAAAASTRFWVALGGPITLAIGTIVALGAAWAKFTGDWTRGFSALLPPLEGFRHAWLTIGPVIEEHKGLLEDLATIMTGVLAAAWTSVADIAVTSWKTIVDAATRAWAAMTPDVTMISEPLKKAFGEFRHIIEPQVKAFDTLKERSKLAEDAVGLLALQFADIKGPAVKAVEGLTHVIQQGLDPLIEKLFLAQGAIKGLQPERKPEGVGVIWGPGVDVGSAALGEARAEIAKIKAEIAALPADTKKAILELDALGQTTTKIADRFNISEEAVKTFLAQVQKAGKAAEVAEGPWKKLTKDITVLNAELKAAEKEGPAAYAIAIEDLGDKLLETSRRAIRLGKEIDPNSALTRGFLDSMEAWSRGIKNLDLLPGGQEDRPDPGIKFHEEEVERTKRQTDLERKAMAERRAMWGDTLNARIEQLAIERQEMIENARAQGDFTKDTLDRINAWHKAASERMVQDWKKGLEQIPTLAQTIFGNIPGFIQQAFTGGGGIMGALQALGSDIGAQLFGEKGPLGFGAGGIFNTLGNKLTGLFGDAFGLALPGIGGAIGSLIGPLLGKLSGLFGVSPEIKAAREELEKFQTTLRGTLTDAQKAEAGGHEWAETLIPVRDLYLAIGRTAAEAERDVAAAFDTDNPERSKAAIERINAALKAQQQFLADNKGEADDLFKGLVDAAAETGEKLPAALQPAIDSLLRMGLITQEQADELRGLTEESGFNLKQLQDDAEALGIEFNALGPKFQQAGLTAKFEELWPRINRLIAAGGDVGTVLAGSADEISALVNEARLAGVSLPAQFEPWVKELARAGKLLDENGNAITDLEAAGVTFGDPLVTAIDKVIDRFDIFLSKVDELFDKLSKPPSPTINIRGSYIPPDDIPEGAVVDPQNFQKGTYGELGRWFVDFGRGTLARLHDLEAVVPKDEALPFATAVLGDAMRQLTPDIRIPDFNLPVFPPYDSGAAGEPVTGEKTGFVDMSKVVVEMQLLNRKFEDFRDSVAISIRDAAMGAV